MNKVQPDAHVFSEVQLLLAEKQVSLSSLRTGIAIFSLPISTFSVLVATSHYYEPSKVVGLLTTLIALNAGLIALGIYMIVRAIKHIHHFDALIRQLKEKNRTLADYIA